MSRCYYFPAEQNRQIRWCGDIAQCLGGITSCIFQFKTKLIFVFIAPGGKRGPGRKIPSSDRRFRIVAAGGSLYFKD